MQDREFKLSLHADDVLLMLTSLHTTLQNLHAQLDNFSALSGYKINIPKTEALHINLLNNQLACLKFNFKYHWKESTLKYMGIYLTTSHTSLFSQQSYAFNQNPKATLQMEKPSYFSLWVDIR